MANQVAVRRKELTVKPRVLAVFCSFVATISIALATAHQAKADDWRQLSNYPSVVQALQLDGFPMDQNHSITWGSWSVTFGSTLPVARYNTHPETPGVCAAVEISGLECNNAVDGRKVCSMTLSPNCGGKEGCAIGGTGGLPIVVHCPTNITFKR
jgi:hypothetical protein